MIAFMKFIQKLLISTFWLIISASLNFGHCLNNWQGIQKNFDADSRPIVDNEDISTSVEQWSHKFSTKLEWILQLPEKNEYETSLGYVMSLIQISINRLLWILAFIALVYMLYCGFLVFSSGSDDKNASKGKKWISTAAIALAWVGLSWLIISAMIRFINLVSSN